MSNSNFQQQGISLNHIKLTCDLQNAIGEYQDCRAAYDNGTCDSETLTISRQNLTEIHGLWHSTMQAINDYCNSVTFGVMR